MKRTRMFLLLAVLLCCNKVFADGFTESGIAYTTTSSTEVSVANGGTYTGDITIPSSVTHNKTTYSVNSIGVLAFDHCETLATVNSQIETLAGFSLGTDVFSNLGTAKLNIPFGTDQIYKDFSPSYWGFSSVNVQESAVVTVSYSGCATYCSPKALDFSASGGAGCLCCHWCHCL